MPAIYTFNVLVNLPPNGGTLVIEPSTGISIDTIFTISGVGFIGNLFYNSLLKNFFLNNFNILIIIIKIDSN